MNKFLFSLLFIFLSCGASVKKKPYPQVTRSSDIKELGKLIDLKKFKPISVDYIYTLYDNSGMENRSIPGPSDHSLRALLVFNDSIFDHLLILRGVNPELQPLPDFKPTAFNFEFLDEETRTQLLAADTAYHGDHDHFFGTNGQVWFLKNKILLNDPVQ
jgi:hypothetical protein